MDELMSVLQTALPDANLANPTGLVDRGVLDSLDIVTLVDELSAHYGVTIPPQQIRPQNFNSVQAMLEMLEALR